MRLHHVDLTSLQRSCQNDVEITSVLASSALLGMDNGNNVEFQLIKKILANRNCKTCFEIGVPNANPCTKFDV